MILRRLRLERFGPFRQAEWTFGPGLNVVRGPNESGKSHLREAITRLLFDQTKVTTNDSRFLRVTTWGADRSFALAGEFTVGDSVWRLEKDFAADTVLLVAADGSCELRDQSLINERLHELIGENARDVYTSTACLEQQDFARLAAGHKIGELLQQTVTGGDDTSVNEVLETLHKHLEELSKGTQRHAERPGPIQARRNEINQLSEQISELEPLVSEAESARIRLDEVQELLQQQRQELENLERTRALVDERIKLDDEHTRLQQQCEELDREWRLATELSAKIAALDEQLAGQPQFTDEQITQIEELSRKAQHAQEQAASLTAEAERLAQDAAQAAQELAAAQERAVPTDLLSRAADLEQRVRESQEAVRAAQDRVSALEAELQASTRRGTLALGLFVAALALIVGGVTLGWAVAAPLYALVIAGLGLGVWAFRVRPTRGELAIREELGEARRQLEGVTNALEAAQSELEQLLAPHGVDNIRAVAELVQRSDRDLEELKEKATAARTRAEEVRAQAQKQTDLAASLAAELAQALEAAGFADDLEGWRQQCQQTNQLREQRRSAADKLSGLLGGRTIEQIEDARTKLNLERDAAAHKLKTAEMQTAAMKPEEYQALIARIQELQNDIAQKEAEVQQLRVVAEDRRADPEALRVLQERRAAAQQSLERLEEKRDALQLAEELLQQARRETMSRAVEHLEPCMSQLLAPLTGGHYTVVKVKEDTLEPEVISPEKKEALDTTREASCATREQIFLAARLALTELLWPQEPPPILLDDPLVNFDANRHEAAVTILRRLAQRAQVIVFTCHEWYDQYADQVIVLPGPD